MVSNSDDAICMVLKASFDSKFSHIARYALSFTIKNTLPIPYKSHHQNL